MPTTKEQRPAASVSSLRDIYVSESIICFLPFQAADKGSRKRYEPADKDRQGSPPAKRVNLSPDRGEESERCSDRVNALWHGLNAALRAAV